VLEEFNVETVLDKRVNEEGKTEYLIRWEGYPEEDSWEEVTNLYCPDKIREYERSKDLKTGTSRPVRRRFAKGR
jgi:hypothetical protein